MKPILNNRYGYKICYTEGHSKELIRRFITYNYCKAKQVRDDFRKHPPPACDGHKIKKPKWFILPITIKEIRRGIWREVPF